MTPRFRSFAAVVLAAHCLSIAPGLAAPAKETALKVYNPMLVDEWSGRRRAERGEPDALYNRAIEYLFDVPANESEARRWFERAAVQGHAWSQYELGRLWEAGRGGSRDAAQALRWYREAAAQSEPRAGRAAGRLLRTGAGIAKDLSEARRWLDMASCRNDGEAQIELALLLAEVGGHDVDVLTWLTRAATQEELGRLLLAEVKRQRSGGQAIAPATLAADWVAAAKRGEPDGRFFTALAARFGIGRPVAEGEARQAFEALAASGQPRAMFQLALMSEDGVGGAEDNAGATAWFAKAAGQGHGAAQFMMARVEALDEAKSQAWLLKAATQGLPEAQAQLGAQLSSRDDTHDAGRGWLLQAARAGNALAAEYLSQDDHASTADDVPEAAPEALHWMRVAADAGLPQAQQRLGEHLVQQGAAAEGLAWLERAAAVDFNAAQALAEIHERGQGVPEDALKAARWYAYAAAKGHPMALFGLSRLLNREGAAELPFALIVPVVRREAEKGNMVGLHARARLQLKGWGMPVDAQAALRDYRLAGEAGDAMALAAIGRMYAEGDGVPRNDAEAVAWFEKAKATPDGLVANVALARMLRDGRGTRQDAAKALALLVEADERGLGEASYELGAMHERGQGVPVDLEKAKRYFERAAANHWPAAEARMKNYVTVDGQVRLVDGAGHREALERRAEAGEPAAQFELAEGLLRGEGGSQDVDAAVAWLTRAAERGHAPAQLALARLLAHGVRVQRGQEWVTVHANPAEAMRWFREHARTGPPEAKLELARQLEYGPGADPAEALRWAREAAEAGLVEAQLAVAEMYADGRGTPVDGPRAIAWAEAAAKHGHVGGYTALWRFYNQGTGVPRDPAKGMPFLVKAAEAGDETAMIWLAEAYETGNGVAEDLRLAATWYTRAARPYDSGRGGFGAANIYLHGPTGIRNEAEAHRWYLTGIQHWIEGGDGTDIFGEEGFAWFKERYGDLPTAQFALGRRFERGDGLPKDVAAARSWYTVAASFDREYPAIAMLAHLKLAALPPSAKPQPTDTPQAHLDKAAAMLDDLAENPFRVVGDASVNWPFDQAFPHAVAALRQAAERGHGQASYELAWLLRHGRGVPRNAALAAQWNALATRAGYFPARAAGVGSKDRDSLIQAVLAYQDRPEALPALWRSPMKSPAYLVALQSLDAALKAGKLGPHAPPRRDDFSATMVMVHDRPMSREELAALAKSANMSIAQAEWFMGAARLEARADKSATPQEAFRWLREAAEKGWTPAMARVGEAYLKGEGVGKNGIEAIKWHTLAVSLGFDRWPLNRASKQVSASTIAQGEAAATAWWTQRHKVPIAPGQGGGKR